MDIRRFLGELKGRGVYRVAGFYAAGSWALLQVADVFFPILGLPDWAITSLLAVAAAGFPLAMGLAWVFDLTPEGIVETPSNSIDLKQFKLSPYRILELFLIVALVGMVGFLYLERLTPDTRPPHPPIYDRPAIAVMAFDNLSDDPSANYFGDGLAEEILNLLARLSELNVAARTSSFYFKGKSVDLRDVGKKLGVDHVLEGSVRRAGNQVRVTAQLIEMKTGYHVWSQTYDRSYTSLFKIQDEIARQVVDALQVILSDSSRAILEDRPELAPRAYDYYLQGREYLRGPLSQEDIISAVQLFQRAIDLEPAYTDAFAGICDARLALYSQGRDTAQFSSAETACRKALTLDGNRVAVLVALGNLYRVSGEYEQALQSYQRALKLDTTNVDAVLGIAETYHDDNQPELAEEAYRTAIQLKPNYWLAYRGFATFLFDAGRFEEAIPHYKRITELMPDTSKAYNGLGAAYLMLGDFAASAEALQRSLEIQPTAIAYSNAGTSLFLMGEFGQAARMYLKALESGPQHFHWLGNLADAYRHLEGMEELAESTYRKAIELAEESLTINATDAQTLGLIAHYYASVGEREKALFYIEQARSLAPGAVYVQYNAATTFCAIDEIKRAGEALREAVANGYPRHLIVVDANLCSLVDWPEFQPGAQ
ncbi:tetratricopeptide repeat protein [Parahaliea maris]|uniref:Tetratricopeptide repeat protein n=1 Tax=Parahaliea maris TaxID=2716870 RepID=A0A5C9A9L1_9GAMM|nr:tetratricopeptide repeat protein [Parahaliea maris]TXS95951.1 tetratricopeptide repeat protein [Parahaliea maris]